MAYEGARKKCLCIKSMDLLIGKKKQTIFLKGKRYPCVITDDDKSMKSYKIYGEEFDLSCSEIEFGKHFSILYQTEKK